MARETLTQVLETIKTLEPDELREVQEAVQERLGPRRYSCRAARRPRERRQAVRQGEADGLVSERPVMVFHDLRGPRATSLLRQTVRDVDRRNPFPRQPVD